MRGKAIRHAINFPEHRITPAYAGKRPKRRKSPKLRQDHPRLCGEKWTKRFQFILTKGSPPPMRGKVTAYSATDSRLRITPAYAGKSSCNTSGFLYSKDHPRLCGEKLCPNSLNIWKVGSPPPMRGKGCGVSLHIFPNRITPAYAGKSVYCIVT